MQSPLHAVHQQQEADFQAYAETPIVLTFGEPQAEYAAIRKAAAILDFPQRGLLELTGKDRLPFLNNLLTNQTFDKPSKTPMPPHTGVYAFFLNLKGRITADMTVLNLPDRTWLEIDSRLIDPLRAALEKYLFTEQVQLSSRINSLYEFFIEGPMAAAAISRAAGQELPPLDPLASTFLLIAGHQVLVWRDDVAAVPGFGLIFPIEAAAAIWHLFTDSAPESPEIQELKFRGLARPAGWAAYNTTRIEAGRALFGIDFDDSVLPAETPLFSRAISLTKGCYLGQEIVARMHARGQIARKLVGIRMDTDALPISGSKIYDPQQNEVGGITSSTISPILSNASIAVGLVKKPFFEIGTRLHIPAEGAIHTATVVDLPFLEAT